MGQSQSRDSATNVTSPPTPSKAEDLVDLGHLLPQGIYPSSASDFDHRVVRRLIQERRIAPFYKGLADEPDNVHGSPASSESSPTPSPSQSTRERSGSGGKGKDRENAAARQRKDMHRKLYGNGTIECPICFLYYPENTNYARCCDQPICTECFVQIRRPPDSPSTPPSCPFCVEPNFGVTYHPPDWSNANKRFPNVTSASMSREDSAASALSSASVLSNENRRLERENRQRRKSINHTNPEVVTIDVIRPDWNRPDVPRSHAVSRRNSASSAHASNQLNPVSRRLVGRTAPNHLSIGGSSRSRASSTGVEYGGYMAAMRHMNMNMDLEELMVMEAIRVSLLEQEARETKERGERAREATGDGDGADVERAGPSEEVEVQDGPSVVQRMLLVDDDSGTDIDTDADTDTDVENPRFDPIVTVTEHTDDSSSSALQSLSWEARNKDMPPPPPREDASSSAGLDFKAPIREVGEANVIEQPEEDGSIF